MVERAATLPDARRAAPLRRQAAAAPDASRRPRVDEATGSLLLCLLIFSLAFPISFYLGETRLSVYRVLLLAAIAPLVLRWVSGAAGRVTAVDLLVLAHCLWMGLAILVVHGAERLAFVAITTIELFGGYLIGRTLVTNRHVYKAFFRYFIAFLIMLFPFAVHELLTERVVLQELFAPFFETYSNSYHEPRAGFWRVQTTFEHPILFGLFCSIGMGNVFYIYRNEIAKQLPLTGFVIFMTFCSLSSAALLSVFFQSFLIAWDKVTKARWWLLVGISAVLYVTIDMLSNRTPITILISVATFDPWTAWTRIAQFNHASAEVMRNPVFGIGFGSWQRPGWLAGSIDNYWLAISVRSGLPTLVLILAALALHVRGIVRAQGLDAELKDYRTGYLIALVGVILTLCTVHIWGGTSVFVMAYIGAGAFFYTQAAARTAERGEADAEAEVPPRRARRGRAWNPAAVPDPEPEPLATSASDPAPEFTTPPSRDDYFAASRGRGPIRARQTPREGS